MLTPRKILCKIIFFTQFDYRAGREWFALNILPGLNRIIDLDTFIQELVLETGPMDSQDDPTLYLYNIGPGGAENCWVIWLPVVCGPVYEEKWCYLASYLTRNECYLGTVLKFRPFGVKNMQKTKHLPNLADVSWGSCNL